MMNLRRAWTPGFVLASLAGLACHAPREEPARAPTLAETEARAGSLVESGLRALFPEIEGPITRASIARLLATTPTSAPGADDSSAAAELVRRARAALDRGAWLEARETLDLLLVADDVARARDALARGDARAALAALDRAVEVAPDAHDVVCLRGEVGLGIAEQDRDPDFARSAQADFQRAARRRGSVRALVGASRAARFLGDGEGALEWARLAQVRREQGSDPTEGVSTERTLAEAALAALAGAERASDVGLAARRRVDARTALEALIERAPADAWAWIQLADMRHAEGAHEAARAAALGGLAHQPDDPGLHERFARAVSALGGRQGLVAAYRAFRAAHPLASLAHWYLAQADFDSAVLALGAGSARAADFEDCERGFQACRALDAAHARACRMREALCRGGVGWVHVAAGDLDRARAAFLSAEDAIEGGLLADVPGALRSAAAGLDVVGRAFERRSRVNGEFAGLADLERAARIFDYLHEYDPKNVDWANNAGFADRDTAVALELEARKLASAGQKDEANRRLARARELMEKSFAAYSAAAALAPDEPRIQNDTGLILTYYLQRDVPTAKAYLRRAVELSEARLPGLRALAGEPEIDARERDARRRALEETESALGDAYQNLGVLYLTLEGEAAVALEWLEKSLRTGPDPREEVRAPGGYLELCRRAIEKRADPRVDDRSRWAAEVK